MANLFGLSKDNINASGMYIKGKSLDDVYINENQENSSLVNLSVEI